MTMARHGNHLQAGAVGCLGLLLLLAPLPARANGGIAVTAYKFPSIVVVGNGETYTGVTGIGYAWEATVEVDTGTLGRIKEWMIWPSVTVEGQSTLELKTAGVHKWYPSASDPWPRPKHVTADVARLFPDVSIKAYVVEACNRNADRLRQLGQSNKQIFGATHQLNATSSPLWSLDLTVGGDTNSEAFVPVTADIRCEKWAGAVLPPPKGGDDFAGEMEVREAKLVVFPGQHAGACPVQLSLFAKVTGNRFGSFESWVESTEGWKSTKSVRSIDGKTNGAYEESFTEKVSVPIVRPAGSPGGGGGAGAALGGGALATPRAPIDPIGGQGGSPASPSAGLTTGKPANVHQAALRVVAHAGGKTVASPWQDYKVTCDPKVAPGLVPFDALAADVRVTQSSLAVAPRTSLLGKCEVELRGKIWTNVAFADVTLAYRNHKGVTTPPREVTTGADRTVSFTDTLDFSKAAGGLWIEQGGVIGPGGGQAGPYAGSFQLVGQSVIFQSSPAPYSFTCSNQAPGGLVAKPRTPHTSFPPVGPLTGAPRDPEPGGAGPQGGGGAMTLGPQGAQKTGPQVATLAVRVDFAATVLVLAPAGSAGAMLTARIANRGTAPATGEYRVLVKNHQGQVVFERSGRAQLDPGEQQGISERVPSPPHRRLTATLVVQTPGDVNPGNNQKTASALLP
jgi:hypothetical protein